MPAPKGRYPPARYHQVPEHTEPLRMSQCWMRWPEWPKRVAPETIDRRDGNYVDYDRAAGEHWKLSTRTFEIVY